eukprot:30135-Pelagococcus_subviridis.AAC.10
MSDAFSWTCHPNVNAQRVACESTRSALACVASSSSESPPRARGCTRDAQLYSREALPLLLDALQCAASAGAEKSAVNANVIPGVIVGNTACVCAPVPPCPAIPPTRCAFGASVAPTPSFRAAAARHLSPREHRGERPGGDDGAEGRRGDGDRDGGELRATRRGESESESTAAAVFFFIVVVVVFVVFFFFRRSRVVRGVKREQVRRHRGRGVREHVLRVHERAEQRRGEDGPARSDRRERARQQSEQRPVVLEVDVVHEQQPRVEKHEDRRDRALALATATVRLLPATVRLLPRGGHPRERARREERVARDHAATHERRRRRRIVRRARQRQHPGVDAARGDAHQAREPSEQRGVIERPLRRRVDVPTRDGSRADGEPVSVHLTTTEMR